MIVRAFIPDDLQAIRLQKAQAWLRPHIDTPAYVRQVQQSDAYTFEEPKGVLAVAAFFTIWPGRVELCGLLSDLVGPSQMLSLHRATRRLIDRSPGRIEATVDGRFEEGHRWMQMLGFTCETPNGMRGYLPNGGTSYLYARLQ